MMQWYIRGIYIYIRCQGPLEWKRLRNGVCILYIGTIFGYITRELNLLATTPQRETCSGQRIAAMTDIQERAVADILARGWSSGGMYAARYSPCLITDRREQGWRALPPGGEVVQAAALPYTYALNLHSRAGLFDPDIDRGT